LRCDLHVHTKHSYDSLEEMADYCERAIALGITHLCFTDHIDMNPLDSGHGIYDFDAYFDDYDRIRRRYAGRLTVLSGLEFAEPHVYTELFESIKAKYPFDYILGSLHWTRNRFPASFNNSGWTMQEAYTYYWEEMAAMVACGGFDAVSHLDLPKRYMKKVWYDADEMRAIMRTIVENGLKIEVNTSTLRNGVGETMPGPDVLRLYREAGGTHVLTGSDAHFVRDLGAGIDEAKNVLNALGLGTGYYANRTFIEEERE
jgi:histidinol-phosphatase (PHP family)